jgi:hypothetical protein
VATDVSPRSVTLADVNRDGRLDLIVANGGPGTQTGSTISVFLGTGTRALGPRIDTAVGRWPCAIAAGDLDGDGIPDLAVAEGDYLETLSILHGLGNGTFSNRRGFVLGSNATSVAIGDVTGDGRPDVALATYYPSGKVFVLPGHGDGSFASEIELATPDRLADVHVADVTGDGRADVVLGSVGVSLFAAQGGGSFAPRQDFAAGGGPFALADLDEDGIPDAATANNLPSNSLSVLTSVSGGLFASRVDYGAGDAPAGVAAADVDNDGLTDLVSANSGSNSVSVLINTGGLAWLPWLGAPGEPGRGVALALTARPDPARVEVLLEFTLPQPARLSLSVFDVAGRRLGKLAEGEFTAGNHRVHWCPSAAAGAGVRFIELRAGGRRVVRRVVLLQ